MNIHVKSIIKGVLGYLLIQIIVCMLVNRPGTSIIAKTSDAFIVCAFVGPLMWVPLLIYPGFFLLMIFTVSRWKKKTIGSSLMTSAFIFYGIGLILAQYVFELFKNGTDPWKMILIALISCLMGFLFMKVKVPTRAS